MNTYEGVCPVCKNTSQYHLKDDVPTKTMDCNTCGTAIIVTLKKGK